MTDLIAYAPRVSGRVESDLRLRGWRTLLQPNSRPCRPSQGMRWALDNGAWYAHQRGEPWDEAAFVAMLERHADGADWVVAPDIVAGGMASLERSVAWLPALLDRGLRVLIAVQDGMETADVEGLLGPRVGVFVGGSTDWKLRTLPAWGELARRRACWLHVGRVNTARRIRLCQDARASSFDGSSPVQFPSTLARLDHARKKPNLWGGSWV